MKNWVFVTQGNQIIFFTRIEALREKIRAYITQHGCVNLTQIENAFLGFDKSDIWVSLAHLVRLKHVHRTQKRYINNRYQREWFI